MEQSPSSLPNTHPISQIPPFMELEDSLPCSQDSVTRPYPELDESSPHLPTLFPSLRSIQILSTYLRLGLPSGLQRPQPEEAPCRGDKDPRIPWLLTMLC